MVNLSVDELRPKTSKAWLVDMPSKSGVQVAPPLYVRHAPPAAVAMYMMFGSFGSTTTLLTGPATFALRVATSRLTAAFSSGDGPDENHCAGIALVEPPWITSAVDAAMPVVGVMATPAPPARPLAIRSGTLGTPASLPPNVIR